MVEDAEVSGDEIRVVSGSRDRTVRVWPKGKGTWSSSVLGGHKGGVKSVSLSKNRTYVVPVTRMGPCVYGRTRGECRATPSWTDT